ncbi:FGGY-family carbohydrate kinase [Glaciimonas sp. PAMC28666]|uniref:FGGY-family carbohydrate kinase n=1 Tax=Glaciimonas sp. PAMC28666 TaxID=2807626 RepID=UPI0019640DFC|nr:FGGY family carbohydrate kinase [Glaciimonas sp. PAMC28666]QRX82600.1 L-fuculose kinase [Glaciimonas sp. PAMC28666]
MQSDNRIIKATVVLDIGKTNAKLTLLDLSGKTLAEQRCTNTIVIHGPYPHHDVDRIWNWLLTTLRLFSQVAQIVSIVPITHGATAAVVDDHGLVLPVLDYECALPQELDEQYAKVRPAFSETYSPDLAAGLNLGRQLFWLSHRFPAEFSRARQILTYPQYWAWRLSGIAASEITSLGCHTDLWQPTRKDYSSLVGRMGWTHLLPPLTPSWSALGPLREELCERAGLSAECQILCGIHDSNASLVRYLGGLGDTKQRTVLSTGTWVIVAALGAPLFNLLEQFDMLANVNALGESVACMRFMGGREFSAIAGAASKICSLKDLQCLIVQNTLALPCFTEAGGPFSGRVGIVCGPPPQTDGEHYALATLYCVLMSDYCLDALNSEGPITVEGSFTDNPYFSGMLAILRPQQAVSYSKDANGTTCGGWMLQNWGVTPPFCDALLAPQPALVDLIAYRDRWRTLLQGGQHE